MPYGPANAGTRERAYGHTCRGLQLALWLLPTATGGAAQARTGAWTAALQRSSHRHKSCRRALRQQTGSASCQHLVHAKLGKTAQPDVNAETPQADRRQCTRRPRGRSASRTAQKLEDNKLRAAHVSLLSATPRTRNRAEATSTTETFGLMVMKPQQKAAAVATRSRHRPGKAEPSLRQTGSEPQGGFGCSASAL